MRHRMVKRICMSTLQFLLPQLSMAVNKYLFTYPTDKEQHQHSPRASNHLIISFGFVKYRLYIYSCTMSICLLPSSICSLFLLEYGSFQLPSLFFSGSCILPVGQLIVVVPCGCLFYMIMSHQVISGRYQGEPSAWLKPAESIQEKSRTFSLTLPYKMQGWLIHHSFPVKHIDW